MENSHTIYKPYTYLIGWSKLDIWYYGSEFGSKSKIANPDNLWTKYFTSSDYVKKFRGIYGEPDIIQIRRIFKTAEEAIEWETRVLRKMKVLENPQKWLNRNIAGTFIMNEETAEKISKTTKGKMPKVPWWDQPRKPETLEKSSRRMKENNPSSTPEARKKKSNDLKGKPGFFTGRKHKEETKLNWSKNRSGKKRSRSSVEKQIATNTGRKFVHKNGITKKVKKDELAYYLENGWVRGMAKRI